MSGLAYVRVDDYSSPIDDNCPRQGWERGVGGREKSVERRVKREERRVREKGGGEAGNFIASNRI